MLSVYLNITTDSHTFITQDVFLSLFDILDVSLTT